jgi:hypothetical protein
LQHLGLLQHLGWQLGLLQHLELLQPWELQHLLLQDQPPPTAQPMLLTCLAKLEHLGPLQHPEWQLELL